MSTLYFEPIPSLESPHQLNSQHEALGTQEQEDKLQRIQPIGFETCIHDVKSLDFQFISSTQQY